MEYVTIRDLRLKPGEVWEKLRRQRELILTSNGRPVAVISDVNEENVEETIAALRHAGAGRRLPHAPSGRGRWSGHAVGCRNRG